MKTTMVSVSDQDLISRYIRGEKSAFEILVLRHKSRIYSYVQQMVRDRELANDIFQSVFLKALETLNGGRYQEEGKFLPWLMRIAHNQCIDHFRRDKRMPMLNSTDERDVFEYLDLREENAQDRMMRRQTYETMRKMVAHLPEEQREVLVMRIYGDLSFREIADATGVSINTALGRMRYALANLRRMMHKHKLSL
jgi:RNA polymerase sigma-70 factor (ECF subfamily)